MAVASKKKRKGKPGIENSLSATDACNLLQQSPSCSVTLRCVLKMLFADGREAKSFAEDLLANGFLGLVPSILRHSRRKGVATGIEVLGAVSMASLTAHRKVVSDKNAIRALAELLTRADVELLTLASHAVVDLLITPLGCESLKESGFIDHLLHLLCWIGDLLQEAQKCLLDERYPSTSRVAGETDCDRREAGHPCDLLLSSKLSNGSTHGERNAVTIGVQDTDFFEEFEELVTTASTAISALIRNVGMENSSGDLSQKVLNFLRRFWHTLLKKDQILRESTAADDEPKWTCNRRTRQIIAKCVVQLAMEVDSQCTNLSVQQGLFEKANFNQKLFFGKYWEHTPMVLSRELPSCLSEMSQKFATLTGVVKNFLGWTVGCPRAIADLLDSLRLLESIESDLGEPMIYGQDIRIVKTVTGELDAVSPTKTPETTVEIHYNGTGPASGGQVKRYVHPREILEGIGKGYTVAIKGMELRCSSISDVADCLAKQCGQPSVGVNLYITPPNAQGLDLHYDDHCVFVCQLVGRKMWNVFPPQKLLPRLYSCRTLDRGALDNLAPTVYNLEEGDVLYIPRGFPHRAKCEQQGVSGTCLPGLRERAADEPTLKQNCFSPAEKLLRDEHRCKNLEDNTAEENFRSFGFEADQDSGILDFSPGLYSLHLTFGVEVEPPFEWEGLLHIALRLWTEQRWQIQATSRQSDSATKESCNRYEQFCEGLLHIAINLLGEKEVLLRKACMIAAESPPHSSSELRKEATPSPKADSNVFVCEQGNSSVCNVCDPLSVEYFQKLLEVVAHKASYKEAYGFAEGLSGDCIGSCPGVMEWLRHIPHPGGEGPTSLLDPVKLVMNQFNEGKMLEVEVAFSNMKAEFGRALFFHQASEAFRSIHSQYRIMRRKFTDGMLALHENC